MWRGLSTILKKTENGIVTYETIVNAVIYPTKFMITYQNGNEIPFGPKDKVIYEVLHNGKSLGILKKKAFKDLSKEKKYEIYNLETGKRAAYPRKDVGLIETRVYREWEEEKNEKV